MSIRDLAKGSQDMTRYLISFDVHAMDHIPDEDMPRVAKAARAAIQDAVNEGLAAQPIVSHGRGDWPFLVTAASMMGGWSGPLPAR